MLELGIDDLLTTTRSVRKRLDYERPVSRAVVEECAQLAFQAPNGGNVQGWGWVCVDDPATRSAMADLYRQGMRDHINRDRTGEAPYLPGGSEAARQRMTESVMHLHDRMQEVPVLLVPTIDGRLDGASIFNQASRWGSILPGVWNFMLALRSRGLGSAWTTVTLYREREMAELLGIPYERHTQAGLFPIAYTTGTDFKRADRSRSRVRWNSWNG
jgi:nitroreductase